MKGASATTTFAKLITEITPEIEKAAKDAIQTLRKAGKDDPTDPSYQQVPQAEGATNAHISEFMRGFNVNAPPPSKDTPPAPVVLPSP